MDISKILERIQLPILDIPVSEETSGSSVPGGYELRRAIFQVFPRKKMSLDASVALKGLAPVTTDVGFLRSGFLINDSPLMKVAVRGINGNFGSETVNLDIGADVSFEENEKTPVEVASIVYAATHDTPVGSALKLNNFGLGFSENDKVNLVFFTRRLKRFRKLFLLYLLMHSLSKLKRKKAVMIVQETP